MASDILLDNDNVRIEGSVGVGVTKPLRTLHVDGSEIHSGGSVAGFSFSDRGASSFVENPTKGERWVWYASKGAARLWSGKNLLQINAEGDLDIGDLRTKKIQATWLDASGDIHARKIGAGNIVVRPPATLDSTSVWITNDSISFQPLNSANWQEPLLEITGTTIRVQVPPPTKFAMKPTFLDLVKEIQGLLTEVKELKAKVAALEPKPKPGTKPEVQEKPKAEVKPK